MVSPLGVEQLRHGMTLPVAQTIDSLLIEIMPMGSGGMFHPSRTEFSSDDQELLKRVEHATFELTCDACRYLRDLKLVEVCAHHLDVFGMSKLNGTRVLLVIQQTRAH